MKYISHLDLRLELWLQLGWPKTHQRLGLVQTCNQPLQWSWLAHARISTANESQSYSKLHASCGTPLSTTFHVYMFIFPHWCLVVISTIYWIQVVSNPKSAKIALGVYSTYGLMDTYGIIWQFLPSCLCNYTLTVWAIHHISIIIPSKLATTSHVVTPTDPSTFSIFAQWEV